MEEEKRRKITFEIQITEIGIFQNEDQAYDACVTHKQGFIYTLLRNIKLNNISLPAKIGIKMLDAIQAYILLRVLTLRTLFCFQVNEKLRNMGQVLFIVMLCYLPMLVLEIKIQPWNLGGNVKSWWIWVSQRFIA